MMGSLFSRTTRRVEVRSVPMIPDVAQALAGLSRRERFMSDDDPVFTGSLGGHLDASALRRRYAAAVKRAGLRALPFHSLRHYLGAMAVNRAVQVQVQTWWATPTSRRRPATCTPRAGPTTRRFWRGRSPACTWSRSPARSRRF